MTIEHTLKEMGDFALKEQLFRADATFSMLRQFFFLKDFLPNFPGRFAQMYSRISLSRTRISQILQISKRLSESKIHFDCFFEP